MSASMHKRKPSDEVPLLDADDDKYHKPLRDDAPVVESYVGEGRQYGQTKPSYEAGSPTSWRRIRAKLEYLHDRRPRVLYGAVVAFLSLLTRYWGLALPESVCWDETHFGKFANHYIHGQFYFDVHPPLGKMLIGLAGYLTGYRGEHEFKQPGQEFGDSHYYGMRLLCASFGAALPMLVYGIMCELDFSVEACVIAASMLIFDTYTCTLSRYILLDPILMFFIIASVYCYCKFYNTRRRPFSAPWWGWMAATGVMLACAFGTKWVGLFVILFIGLSTAIDLWDLIGDLSIPVRTLSRHFLARVLCLIVLPICVYTAFFWIHFAVLPNSGPGDGFMSSAFQTRLKGNALYRMENPRAMAYGSVISVKSHRVSGGLLHSHPDTYPKEVGPPQQQVTTYAHKDSNNEWRIKKDVGEPNVDEDPVEYVKNGDYVRLEHIATKRNMHSHNNKAPITTEHYQVTCYGNNGVGDDNDVWQIQVYEPDVAASDKEGGQIRLLTARFRLIHKHMKCALHQGGVNLPKWGWEQGEVTCNPNIDDPNNLWNLETIRDSRLPKESTKDLSPGFLRSMYELHIVMKNVNNNMKPKEDEVVSKPWHWPILYKGQHFTAWGDDDQKIFLMGNPVIWYGNLVAIGVFGIAYLVIALMTQRGYENVLFKNRRQKLQNYGGWVVTAYLMHYIPFYLMGRILYFHHYFPSLIFSCMLTAIVLDELFFWIWYMAHKSGLTKRTVRVLFFGTLLVLAASFWYFSPFTYGLYGPIKGYEHLRWIRTWDY